MNSPSGAAGGSSKLSGANSSDIAASLVDSDGARHQLAMGVNGVPRPKDRESMLVIADEHF